MKEYGIEFRKAAIKDLRKIPRRDIERIDTAINALRAQPRPVGCRKLFDTEDRYRIRIGDYRVIYTIEDDVCVVMIIRIRHRKDAYRV